MQTEYEIIYGDQKSDDWQKLREGLITGSVAKFVKTTGNAFLYETLAVMTTVRERKQAYSEHIDRGNALEPEARAAYAKHAGCNVAQVAFIRNGRYGISPDGIPHKEKKFTGVVKKMLEVKCPDTNNHIRYIIENKLPSEHRDQVVHGFVVCPDLQEIDFVSYCPVFKFKPLHIITIKRTDLIVEISTTEVQYKKFIEKLDTLRAQLIL